MRHVRGIFEGWGRHVCILCILQFPGDTQTLNPKQCAKPGTSRDLKNISGVREDYGGPYLGLHRECSEKHQIFHKWLLCFVVLVRGIGLSGER